ncbi:MAG: MarR family winged helix-turn-helix transcriptional regulator [Solirubrobacterales bacterium]
MSVRASANQRSMAPDPWVCLLRGHAAVRRTVATQLRASHGLTVNDYEALLLLSRSGPTGMRRVDLADSLQLTASGVTRLLEGLERHGLVAKALCATDGRVTYAVLTKAGREKLAAASGSHLAAIRTLFEERYTRAELATLADLLARLQSPTVAAKGHRAA